MKIGICSDHAGFEYKSKLIPYLEKMGYEVEDFGTHSTESMDYPDVAHPLAIAVESGKVDCGIAMCGTGNGMAMTLNKHQGIRAGLAWGTEIGKLVKAHNNANVLVMLKRVSFLTRWCRRLPRSGLRHRSRAEDMKGELKRFLASREWH